jgi:serine/threonine protein kinase
MAFSLQDYEISAEIGRGGYGSVFRARQKALGREVAIKQLSPVHTQQNTEIIRFRREAESMAALSHDNIIVVFDYAFHAGSYYIVMEYIDGMSLDSALGTGLDPVCGLFILEKCASALAYAHAEQIIHRDIKPANILLGKNGQVKLADFGLAMQNSGSERYTGTGLVLGTLNFLAPEALVSPKDVDAKVDVFAFGCILYRVIAGTLPFDGESVGDISYKILNREPDLLARHVFSERLADLTMACLIKDREKRPAMADVHAALAAEAHDRCRTSREDLISFIRGATAGTRESGGPTPSKPAGHSKPLSKASKRILIGASALFVLAIIASILAANGLLPWQVKRDSSLPELETLNQDVGGEPSAPVANRKPVRSDAPQPIAGSNMNSGTIIITSGGKGDSVLINGRCMSVLGAAGLDSIELPADSYRLEVHRTGTVVFRRKVQLSVGENIDVAIKAGETGHGR